MNRPAVHLRVAAVTDAAPGVRSLELAAAPGTGPLPAAPPGGHIGVEWAPGRWNSYSLTAPSPAPDRWHVSVARRPDSRGGSVWAHGLAPGDAVVATTPRSSFPPVDTARHHLLVAGGIGVTPILSHARWHAFWGTRSRCSPSTAPVPRHTATSCARSAGTGWWRPPAASRPTPRWSGC
ncbi:hypothetical protein WY02_00880 [Pseudonocardia sp. AL041005-10]|nr:hypothetical protein [Pseudonocardia sp. AL041005-10]ALE77276.1 hypothetical protein WY02_00880 [Pseudonocardia sp. AL041005-10]